MKKSFVSEDNRKNRLFEAWNQYIDNLNLQLSVGAFERIYEGLVEVKAVTRNRLNLCFADGQQTWQIPVTPEISGNTAVQDMLYLVLGFRSGAWWPVDVMTIGSIIEGKRGGVHITANPLFLTECQSCAPAQGQTTVN